MPPPGLVVRIHLTATPSCLVRALKISPFLMIASPSPQQTVPQSSANLIISILPRRLRPFALLVRLDKPIGTWLLLWPGLWSIALAAPALPDVRLLALFAAGALVMRSAGCVFNDIVDRDFDARARDPVLLGPLPGVLQAVLQATLHTRLFDRLLLGAAL